MSIPSLLGAQVNEEKYSVYSRLINKYYSVDVGGLHFLIHQNGKTGLTDKDGKIIFEPRYTMGATNSSSRQGSFNNIVFKSDSELIMTDEVFNVLQRGNYANYWSLDYPSYNFLVFTKDGKAGIRNKYGKWMLPAEYDAPHNYDFVQYPFLLLTQNGKAGVVDSFNHKIVSFVFETIRKTEQYFICKRADSTYLYDTSGKFIVSYPYSDCNIIDGFVVAKKYGSWALLSKDGKLLTLFRYKGFFSVGNNNYIGASGESLNGVLDKNGKVVLRVKYDFILPLVNGFVKTIQWINLKEKEELYDNNFRLVSDKPNITYEEIKTGGNELDTVSGWLLTYSTNNDDGKSVALFNMHTHRTMPYVYGKLFWLGNVHLILANPRDGNGIVNDRKKYLIDKNGKVFPFPLLGVNENNFRPYLIVLSANGKFGVVNSKLEWIVPPRYVAIDYFDDTVVQAYPHANSKEYISINLKHKIPQRDFPAYSYVAVPPVEEFEPFMSMDVSSPTMPKGENVSVKINRFGDVLEKRGLWGMKRYNGDVIRPYEYDNYGYMKDGYWWLEKDDRYTVINLVGTIIADGLIYKPIFLLSGRDTIRCEDGKLYAIANKKYYADEKAAGVYNLQQHNYINNREFLILSQGQDGLESGIYNKWYRRIAPAYRNSIPVSEGEVNGRLIYTDSTGKKVAVIDTAGNFVLPFSKCKNFWLMAEGAIARIDSAQYVVYFFSRREIGSTDTANNLWFFDMRCTPGKYNRLMRNCVPYGILTYERQSAYGLINLASGTHIVTRYKPEYDLQYDTFAVLKTDEGKWGIIDAAGKWKLQPVYDTIYKAPGNSYAPILYCKENGKTGAINYGDFSVIVPPIYEDLNSVEFFKETGIVLAKQGGKYALINKDRKVITSGWDNLYYYSGSGFGGKKGDSQYHIYFYSDDRIVTEGMPAYYENAGGYEFEYSILKNGKRGWYSEYKDAIIVPPIYDDVKDEGPYYVGINYKRQGSDVYVYNYAGKLKFKKYLQYGELEYHDDGDYWTVTGNDAPVFDTGGRMLLPPGYEDVSIMDNLIVATKDDKVGVLDKNRHIVLPFRYDAVSIIKKSKNNDYLLMVMRDDSKRLMYLRDTTKASPWYADIEPDEYDKENKIMLYYAHKYDEKNKKDLWGVIDENWKIQVPFNYESIEKIPLSPEQQMQRTSQMHIRY